jgi:hypothetical protein
LTNIIKLDLGKIDLGKGKKEIIGGNFFGTIKICGDN